MCIHMYNDACLWLYILSCVQEMWLNLGSGLKRRLIGPPFSPQLKPGMDSQRRVPVRLPNALAFGPRGQNRSSIQFEVWDTMASTTCLILLWLYIFGCIAMAARTPTLQSPRSRVRCTSDGSERGSSHPDRSVGWSKPDLVASLGPIFTGAFSSPSMS